MAGASSGRIAIGACQSARGATLDLRQVAAYPPLTMTGRPITTPPPARPEPSRRDLEALVGLDRVVAAYAEDVDETILIENLRLTPQERFDKFVRFMRFVADVRGAARDAEPAAAAAGVDRSPSPHGRA